MTRPILALVATSALLLAMAGIARGVHRAMTADRLGVSVAHSDDPKPAAAPTLSGTITDEHGQPVAGVTIKLYSGFATRFLSQTRITGPDGAFRFDPLLAANGWVGDEMSFGFVIEHPWLCRADGKAWEEIRIKQGQSLGHNAALTTGGAVQAKVTDKTGGDGWSLDIRLMTEDGQMHYATTGADGVFVLSGLRAGTYAAQENNPRYNYPALGTITIVAGELERVNLKHPDDLRARRESEKRGN